MCDSYLKQSNQLEIPSSSQVMGMTDLCPHGTQKIAFHMSRVCWYRLSSQNLGGGRRTIRNSSLFFEKCNEFEVSLDYVRLSQKNQNQK